MKLLISRGLRAGLGLAVALLLPALPAAAQRPVAGRVFDNLTKEPVVGATVRTPDGAVGTATDATGRFRLQTDAAVLRVSSVGYRARELPVPTDADASALRLALEPAVEDLQTAVVTASREAELRTDAPVAISKLSPTVIDDTKPTLLTELINKVPGVLMLNYNNEQHGMSIRQPMGTSAYFLYLEDGVPLRPMGVFNHNALIEMNVLAINSVEVVKGPASSLYGPEAVGGAINFITRRPTSVPTASIGLQVDQFGYQRLQFGAGSMLTPRLGVFVSGFGARQRRSWQTRSDYDKTSLNARLEYGFGDRTRLTGAVSYNDYDSQTGGAVDSVAFYRREYSSATDFTYRKSYSLRARLALEHTWNPRQQTTATAYFRDNNLGQNPSYSLRWTRPSLTATGQINSSKFKSYGLIAQHSARFDLLAARLLAGLTADYSPTAYDAYQIDLAAKLRPDGRSVEKYTLVAERPDLVLADYGSQLLNTAAYAQLDFHPVKKLQLTLGGRYDRLGFGYNNYLDKSSGTRSFGRFTPKVGLTYDLGRGRGLYANYSQGFSPPGLNAIFTRRPGTGVVVNGTAVAADFYYNLTPATFDNKEVGGWAALFDNKVYLDGAVYQMNGRNELLNIRQPDNSTDYQSAGRTLHRGIEYGLTYRPAAALFFRFGGTNALHRFEDFVLSTRATDQVQNVNGKEMPQAPRFIANTEITYKPAFAPGLRASAEYQRIGAWYQNQVNTVRYADRGLFGARGVSLLNVRAGYAWHQTLELFVNVLNVTNELYANSATRGNGPADRTTFTPAAPRTLTVGVQYNFVGQ